MRTDEPTGGPLMASRQLWIKVGQSLTSLDVYTATIMAIYCILSLIYYPYVANASSVIIQDVLIAMTIVAVVLLDAITGSTLFRFLRHFYIIPVIYLMYDQTHVFVRVVHPVDYDQTLITVDRWLFGVDPTRWLSQFSVPALTEYLQICYFLFYIMPIMQAVEWWRRRDYHTLMLFARTITFCYFVSYLLYFVMPAIGPRFTLHEFHALDTDLPGLFLTPWLRDLVDVGGGVSQSMVHPDRFVNRDCMPSGHTMMTLVNIVFAFRFTSRFRWFFLIVGGSLIFSTVYLRYHYGIDVLVGAICAVIFIALEPSVNAGIKRLSKRLRLL